MMRSYRWVMVGLGAVMGCVAIGAMFSLAVFLEPMAADTGWSHAGISAAMTLNFLVMGFAGFGWGIASDRFGPRIVVMTGAALLGLALVLASQATSLLAFQITFGVLVGLSASGLPGADDRGRRRLVRRASRPRHFARLGRHGHGADDGRALRPLADHRL